MANLLTGGLGDSGSEVVIPGVDTTPPTATTAQSVDARTLEVIFSEPVVEVEALNPLNYSVTPTLTVKAVKKVTDLQYRLTTSKQTELVVYNVTVSNVHDLAGNSI